tara:strand:- start:70 stop:399 length:330 start_codon:yes stop_codon:yes gene_type:complete
VIDGMKSSESLLVVGVPIYLALPVSLDVVEPAVVSPSRETFSMDHQIEQPSLESFNTEAETNASSSKIVLYTVDGYGYIADKAQEKKSGLSAWLFGCCDGKRSASDDAN